LKQQEWKRFNDRHVIFSFSESTLSESKKDVRPLKGVLCRYKKRSDALSARPVRSGRKHAVRQFILCGRFTHLVAVI